MIWLLMFLFSTSLDPSQAIIKGQVLGPHGEPILFGNVVIYKNNVQITGTQTDFDGNYSISNIDPGVYSLEASYIGLTTSRVENIIVERGKTLVVNVLLEQGVLLEEVQVKAYKAPLIDRDNTSSGGIVTATKIKNLPITNMGSLASTTAGLKSINNGNVYIKGSRSNQTNYYVDGVRVSGRLIKQSEISSGQKRREETKVTENFGQLTAAEWNPFDRREEWLELQESMEEFNKSWGFLDFYVFEIDVTDQGGHPAPNVEVKIENNGREYFSLTNCEGKLFIPFASNDDKIRVELSGLTYELDQEIDDDKNKKSMGVSEACIESDATIDIAFVVDATSSMEDEFDFLTAELANVIGEAESLTNKNVRVAASYFCNYPNGIFTHNHGFTSDMQELTKFLAKQQALGGYEHIEKGLEHAINNFDWNSNASARIIFAIFDFRFGELPADRIQMQILMEQARDKGIQIIPITGSGLDRKMEYVAKWMAFVTGGTYVGLTDDSGIGGEHLTPITNDYKVEYLNELILRLIVERSNTTTCDEFATDQYNCSNDFLVYPNVTDGPVNLTSNKDVEYSVINMFGQIIEQGILRNGKVSIDLTDEVPGQYEIVFLDDRTTCSKSVILQSGNAMRD